MLLAVLAASTLGCYGEASLEIPSVGGRPDYDDPNPQPPPVDGTGTLHCQESSVPASVSLATISADFGQVVYPAMMRQDSGCVSCHSTTSGRQFKVSADPTETFYAARAAGFLSTQPGSIVSRLVATDESARMPRGQPAWSAQEISAMASLTCQLAAVEVRSPQTPPDEEFPPALLQAYTGPQVATYDNPFLGYVQLKGKVKQVFNDDWIRGGVDKFASHVGLFGGVDYEQYFVEARVASPDFLLGLDDLAADVCLQAARNKTGPFAGLDTSASIIDTPPAATKQYEAETTADLTPSTGQRTSTGWDLYTNGTLTTTTGYNFPVTGTYVLTARAYGSQCGPDLPSMDLRVDGTTVKTFAVTATTYADHAVTLQVTAGLHTVSVAFTNDYNQSGVCDRNLYVDWLKVNGPTEASTGTTRADAAKAKVDTLYRRMLFHPASTQEKTDAYTLVKDLSSYEADLPKAWSGVCEGLMRAPDFLFTLPPSYEVRTGVDRDRLLLVKLAQDLVGRPPNATELAAFEGGSKTWEQMVDGYLASTEFRSYYFHKMRIRTESEGTADTDEPARLWTYLATTGTPMQELLTGDYSVSADYAKVSRPAEHGHTGVLTMKGFIKNKPGLPHYNYAARVMTDFMGSIFEIPSEVFDMRGAATAASTVDPTSICFSCHQTLTPLSHQRLRWNDDGTYRTTDDQGRTLDDSDRGLVGTYAFKGQGMPAFAQQAVKKEAFIRRTVNAQYMIYFGREMRHTQDERVMYKKLWDVAHESDGNLKAVLKTIALSNEYTHR
ncbi:carbohydrate-binding domain-containing protein [Hyalangium versicolor]|uniref:carbohydrate-binding domain-containing protein n=1 Tax=Hyalangium versicolor TaxID=2861190 RepID=UPI001CCBBA5C|nr:carbohydrate-binding domain-containing protein [Hyalangium versicolor]